ncbi:prepilin peptidase [Asticcacaulis sp. 201]|uniref:prepilin peptidase n=1 Tax=Asticcacaulis sp. 201 TaxID=3028787 RepID=UPI002915C8EE|nr:prepilin peptidase [Asticcacaulis sp. 201]MDV6331316.1 prepilin peptidase [Asticcacaulis sp. 201]
MDLVFGAAGLVLGAVMASFGATWALRRAQGEQSVSGRSRCDRCAHALGYLETVPLLSYAVQHGRCRHCAAPISPFHPIAEIGGALLVASIFALRPWPLAALEGGLGITLWALLLVDIRTFTLPDVAVVLAGALSALLGALQNSLLLNLAFSILITAVLLVATLVLKNRRGHAVMGYGDLKLIAGLTLWLGPDMTLALALASTIGLIQFAVHKNRPERIAFGPALIAGTLTIGLIVRPFFSLASQ